MYPYNTAKWIGVSPSASAGAQTTADGLAPAESSLITLRGHACSVALCKAVMPLSPSTTSTCAPCSRSTETASTSSCFDAACSGVSPSAVVRLGSAPASRSNLITCAFPFCAAMKSGVSPSLSGSSTSEPALRHQWTISGPLSIAKNIADLPTLSL